MSDKNPTPWTVDYRFSVYDANGELVCSTPNPELAEHIALAANAEAVMMRRGWTAKRVGGDRWYVVGDYSREFEAWQICHSFDHPFKALDEADRWLKEREAGKCGE